MRITVKVGYCLQHKKEPKKFLNDAEEFVELPQLFETRGKALAVRNVSSFGDKFTVRAAEQVIIIESD